MPVGDLVEWLDEYGGPGFVWYVKRLSANDTLANGSNQAGPYVPREVLFDLYPALNQPAVKNPDVWFDLYVDSHSDLKRVRAVWYNNKLHDKPQGGRNETRLTNLGGQASALLDPESTGALTVFAFNQINPPRMPDCHVWVCRHETEEDLVEDRVGPVEPGKWLLWPPAQPGLLHLLQMPPVRANCWLDDNEIPAQWRAKFPSGADIINKAVELRADAALDPDKRLIRRRECEFEIFRSVERAIELPFIQAGFATVDEFIARAQTILQRRKARSGRSLELHARAIFLEERLVEGTHFAHQPESERGKRPDFLFPSADAYRDANFPADRLRMLAVKTTCKDRWRQILNEADRIPAKHLLTLQEGVSEPQFREMTNAGVQLVVPTDIIGTYPRDVRPHLQTLESFIGDVRLLTVR
ncbi:MULTISPECIES: type II restriction endonuclease [unclassified Blastomonas]|uniref:type II restriction endonuclease n=1 Tax=unclassified Blastomonas TaxID=2626550 RepID=UPI0009E90461|nr:MULTISPECIES: type II restriction endonuclease [unclassified Blastomonas]